MLSIANAQAAAAGQGGSLLSFLPLIALFVVFYFFMIRPTQKRAKEQRELVAGLEKGNEVMTAAGILGKIVELDDTTVGIEVAPDIIIKMQRQSVVNVLPKGTLKS